MKMWIVRAILCLFELLLLFGCRWNLCEFAWHIRAKSTGQKKKRLADTGRQPKALVWLLYTDVRSVRNQDFRLRLNMILWIAAVIYTISEMLLGWIQPNLWQRIVLVLFAIFFAISTFISTCVAHRRDYGQALILYRRNKYRKSESSVFDLLQFGMQIGIGYAYWVMK